MSVFANAPIIELRPDGDFGLFAVVPDYPYGHGGSHDDFAVCETLSAILAYTESLPSRPNIWPVFPEDWTDDAVMRMRSNASALARHDREKRGRICKVCKTSL